MCTPLNHCASGAKLSADPAACYQSSPPPEFSRAPQGGGPAKMKSQEHPWQDVESCNLQTLWFKTPNYDASVARKPWFLGVLQPYMPMLQAVPYTRGVGAMGALEVLPKARRERVTSSHRSASFESGICLILSTALAPAKCTYQPELPQLGHYQLGGAKLHL